MSDYNLFPAVDAGYNFPPAIRQALGASPELVSTDELTAALLTVARSRKLLSVTTSTLADKAEWTGTAALGLAYRLMAITTSAPCRVRIYATTTQRTADASRAIGTDPIGNSGLLFEFVSSTGKLASGLTPAVDGYNLEAIPVVTDAISIQNLSGASAAIITSFTYITTE